MYNIFRKTTSANVSQKVKDLRYGKRASKYPFYLRGIRFDIFCRIPNNLSICKSTSTETISSDVFVTFASQYLLSLGRLAHVPFLFHSCGNRAVRSSDNNEIQWLTTSSYRAAPFAWRQSNARFPFWHNATRPFADNQTSRYHKSQNICLSSSFDNFNSGLRFKCSDRIWESGTCRSRIQSHETWQGIISSNLRFRKPLENKPEWRTSCGQYKKPNRSHTIYKTSPCENPFNYCQVTDTSPLRCRFLLLEHNRFFQRREIWFCHGGTSNATNQSNAAGIALSYVQSRAKTFSSTISLQAAWLERRTTVCCYSSSNNEKIRFTGKYFAYSRPLRIPCTRNKSTTGCGKRMVLLQESCSNGNQYQRAKTRFLYGQNPDKKFCSKSGTLKPVITGLRSFPLVSVNVPATGISIKDAQVDSQKYSYSTGKIHYAGTSEYSSFPKEFYSAAIVSADIQKCSKDETFAEIGRFANDY